MTLTRAEINLIANIINCWCGDNQERIKPEDRKRVQVILRKLAKIQTESKRR